MSLYLFTVDGFFDRLLVVFVGMCCYWVCWGGCTTRTVSTRLPTLAHCSHVTWLMLLMLMMGSIATWRHCSHLSSAFHRCSLASVIGRCSGPMLVWDWSPHHRYTAPVAEPEFSGLCNCMATSYNATHLYRTSNERCLFCILQDMNYFTELIASCSSSFICQFTFQDLSATGLRHHLQREVWTMPSSSQLRHRTDTGHTEHSLQRMLDCDIDTKCKLIALLFATFVS